MPIAYILVKIHRSGQVIRAGHWLTWLYPRRNLTWSESGNWHFRVTEHLPNGIDERNAMASFPLLHILSQMFIGKEPYLGNGKTFLVSPGGLNVKSHQNDLDNNCSSLDSQSNAVYRSSLRCLIFVKSWRCQSPPGIGLHWSHLEMEVHNDYTVGVWDAPSL